MSRTMTRNDISELSPSGSHSSARAACHGIAQGGVVLLSQGQPWARAFVPYSTALHLRHPGSLGTRKSCGILPPTCCGAGEQHGFFPFSGAWRHAGAVRGHGGACQQLSGLLFVLLDGEIPLGREKTCPLWGMESRRRWSGPLPPAALARADSPLSH